MSVFERLDRVASRTIDALNDERVWVIPMRDAKDPNGRRAADVTRPTLKIRGVFEYLSVEYGIELGVRKSYREANDLRAVSVGRQPVVSIDRRYFSDPASEPRQGDHVELPDRPDLPRFEVMDNQRDGHSRMVLRLVHLGQQA